MPYLDPHRHVESSFTSPLSGRKVPLRVYATHDHIAQAGLTLETTAKILPIYEEVCALSLRYSSLSCECEGGHERESGGR